MRRLRPWSWRGLVSVALLAGALLAASSAVRAAVTAITPSSATVTPGEATSAAVRVEREAVSCLRVRGPEGVGIAASVEKDCDSGTWSTRLNVSTSPDTPIGNYTIEVSDAESAQTFVVRVQEPPPPPPPPPPAETTTTAAPAPAPATTAAPNTTSTTGPPPDAAATTTSSEPASSTTSPGATPFVSVADLAETPPRRALFLPLRGIGYLDCLPLTGPCGSTGSGVVLVPADDEAFAWKPHDDSSVPVLRLAGTPPRRLVGAPPPDPREVNYALPILDLGARLPGELKLVHLSIDEGGRLAAPAPDRPVVHPEAAFTAAEGPREAPVEPPFDAPSVVSVEAMSEVSPALVMFTSGSEAALVMGIRPDPAWGLELGLLPLLETGSLPFLARGVDGPPGLLVPIPEGFNLPDDVPVEEPDDEGGLPVWVPIALVGGAGAAAVGTAWALRRRRGVGPAAA